MTENRNLNEIIFFLGAGASIEAGVPDTIKFIFGQKEEGGIQGFIEYLKENKMNDEMDVLRIILKILQQKIDDSIKHEKIDVELVLGTVNALNKKKEFELVYFYDQNTFKFKNEDEDILNNLETILKSFIRRNVVVDKSEINYLAPLTEFKPINIFSVNYDTCIEMLCIKHRLTYTDGFDLYWNPELLNSDKFDVKLFKLHGSIMWYLTDYGNFVKLLSKNDEETDEISLITEEIARQFIIYPMRGKLEYIEPIGYLTNQLQKNLKEAKLCIIVGYSFRDEDIKRIFFDSAKENENLTIVLISPDASRTFNEKLRYRDEEKSIQSPLFNRVICFNYPFGSVLKNSYLYRIKNRIPYIFTSYLLAIDERRDLGTIETFKRVINDALEVSHVYFIENIFEKELGISPPENWGIFNKEEQFRISYKLAIFYLIALDKKGKIYFEFLRDFLNDILSKGQLFFDLNVKLNSAAQGEIKKIEDDITELEKISDFYLWSSGHSSLNKEISSFNTFIQKQLELLNPSSEYIDLLKSTSGACINLIGIFNVRNGTKYRGSEEVKIRERIVKIQKKEDLEKGITDLSNKIEKFVEFYEKNDLNWI